MENRFKQFACNEKPSQSILYTTFSNQIQSMCEHFNEIQFNSIWLHFVSNLFFVETFVERNQIQFVNRLFRFPHHSEKVIERLSATLENVTSNTFHHIEYTIQILLLIFLYGQSKQTYVQQIKCTFSVLSSIQIKSICGYVYLSISVV